jgi:hypothetical protein
MLAPSRTRFSELSIWFYAFGYFAAYAPYSALTKALSKGLLAPGRPVGSFEMLPLSAGASTVAMFVFLTAMGWWKHARHSTVLGVRVPHPGVWTFFSGLCTASIVLTTTLAYTFRGTSIVFMMLLMRGGVLVIAPLVDLVSRRRVRWFSWVGLALSLGALGDALVEKGSYELTAIAVVDVVVYLASYFVRLRFMSRNAKGNDAANKQYFVEEQMVATPAAMVALASMALFGGPIGDEVRRGFTEVPASELAPWVVLVGLLSQGTGVFGGLILLDPRENTYTVPVNRSSSILAGLAASYGLSLWLGQRPPSQGELVGAMLIVAAILFLTLGPMLEKRRAARRAANATSAALA